MLGSEFGIHPETEVGKVTDLEPGVSFVQYTWEEETAGYQEVYTKSAEYGRHHKSAAARDRLAFIAACSLEKMARRAFVRDGLGGGDASVYRIRGFCPNWGERVEPFPFAQ